MYGLHIDHHLISIARDGELLVSAPIAVEFGAPEATVGQHALAVSRRRPTEIALHHWRELGLAGHDDAARRVALEVNAHLKQLGLAGTRIEAVVATPADLGAAAGSGAQPPDSGAASWWRAPCVRRASFISASNRCRRPSTNSSRAWASSRLNSA